MTYLERWNAFIEPRTNFKEYHHFPNKHTNLLPKEKFYIDLADTGNTVSSTVMIGLKRCIEDGTIQKGMKVMVSGFGVGLSWGGTMLRF